MATVGLKSSRHLKARLLDALSKSGESKNRTPNLKPKWLAVFGAGDLGRLALEFCSSCGIDVDVVIETKPRAGIIEFGRRRIPVFPASEFPEANRQETVVLVAVSTSPFTPIHRLLKSYGYWEVIPFMDIANRSDCSHPLANGWRVGEVGFEELQDVKRVCGLWHDKASIEHFEAFVRWHVDSTELLPRRAPIDPNSRYVISQMRKFTSRRHFQFVDVGACRGETLERLSKASVFFDEYLLIEPDEDNRKQLTEKCRTMRIDPSCVQVSDALLARDSREVTFAKGLGYCSQIWPGGADVRSTLPLDDLGATPDVIKIHTEGGEAEIVAGSRKTISSYRPALMIAVYHDRSGISRAILDIANECADYYWLFRLHAFQGTGAFVYGFPKNA